MGIWEAMEKLSELFDDSDPDVSALLLLFAVCGSLHLRTPHPAIVSLCHHYPWCFRVFTLPPGYGPKF